jgi:Holliday junction resolvase RusA-like endonuclease
VKIELIIPIAPVAKERARVTRFHAYTPARTKEFQNQVIFWLIRNYDKPPFDIPLKLTIEFHLAKPLKPKFKHPAVRPDCDNYLKAIMDACNGKLWTDDSLICHVDAKKVYAVEKPHIKMKVEGI